MRTPRLKSPDDVVAEVAARLARDWHRLVCGTDWNPLIRLGTSDLRGHRLREHWSEIHQDTLDWQDWAAAAGVDLELRTVSLHRTAQAIAAAVRVASVDVAASVVGGDWPARLARGRARATRLTAEFPTADVAGVIRAVDGWSDVDVDVLCRSAAWFAGPHPAGLTARQVPVEGLGTKWLDKRQGVVRRLAGLDSLDLVPGRPQRVHVTYLDPDHQAAGGRRHDLATDGDVDAVAYTPRVVLISENRDTAQLFAPVPGGIAIEGDGNGPGVVPRLPWVAAAPHVVYWGDLDVRGLEILAAFRAALGSHVRSLFMDARAYERWERYGVDHDHDGKPLGPRPVRDLAHLEPGEKAVYRSLCSADWTGHRRIEQERIPLDEAAQELARIVSP
ncbi:DUF2220 family protein [Nocardioides maradonensis]